MILAINVLFATVGLVIDIDIAIGTEMHLIGNKLRFVEVDI